MVSFPRKLNSIGRRKNRGITINRQLWAATYCVANVLLPPFYRMKISGAHHIPCRNGFVMLPKHQCWQDIPLLGLSAARPLYYVAKYELFHYPFVHQLLGALGGIPLNRSRPISTRRSFRAAVEVLERGDGLVLFPEGTYFRNSMGDGRSGMLRFILNRIQVPLIPVGIEYTSGQWPQKVAIRFGPPIRDLFESNLMNTIMDAIARLSGLHREK